MLPRPRRIRALSIAGASVLLIAAVQQANRNSSVDAELIYAADFGGSGFDAISDVAVDPEGALLVFGSTFSIDLPTVNAAQSNLAAGLGLSVDAFVAKFSPATGDTVFATYLGGAGFEEAHRITVDTDGNSYVVGSTDASDFPTLNAVQPALSGPRDAFLASYDPQGNLRFSTFFGGPGIDAAFDIALDTVGNIWIVGETAGITSVNPLQNAGGSTDAFIAKLSPTGDQVLLASPLGGSDIDRARAMVIGDDGSIFLSGESSSANFPSVGGLPPGDAKGSSDIFVMKLSSTADQILYSTRFGGSDADESRGIDVDGMGRAYVAGISWSDDLPTVNPTQAIFGGESDAVLAVLNPDGDALEFSTYLGSDEGDPSYDVAVLGDSLITVVGQTFSANFPDDVDPLVAAGGATPRSFVTTFSGLTGDSLSVFFSSTIPGAEGLRAVAPYNSGTLALAGFSRSGVDENPATGGDNGFIGLLKLAEMLSTPPELVVSKALSEETPDGQLRVGEELTYTVVLRNLGGPATNVVVRDTPPDVASVVASPESRSYSGGTVWDVDFLEPGGTRTFTLVLTPDEHFRVANFDSANIWVNRVVAFSSEPNSRSDVFSTEDRLVLPSAGDVLMYILGDVGRPRKRSDNGVDIYVDSVRIADDLLPFTGTRSPIDIVTHLPVIEIAEGTSLDNSQPLANARIDLFTFSGPDSTYDFSDKNLLLVVPSGDSLEILTRKHARFVAGETDVAFTIGHVARDTGLLDVTVSGSVPGVSEGLDFGKFSEYWDGPAGIIDVEAVDTNDAATLGSWRFDLGEYPGEAVTLLLVPAATGKRGAVAMIGVDAQGDRFDAVAATEVEERVDLPGRFQIHPNYPNPVSAKTQFSFSLEQPSQVEIRIFDAAGRLVDRIDAGVLPAGDRAVSFDAGALSPGIYFYQAELGAHSASGSMVVTR